MKILLVGEYSRLHNSLKEGLEKLGNQVTILGFKDGFKEYPVDFPLEKKWDSGLLKKLKIALLRVTGFDMSSYLTYQQFQKNEDKFHNFDVVQLINENSFFCDLKYEKKILESLFNFNKKIFLLSCGDDYKYVKYNFEHPENKSILMPYLEGKIEDKDFSNVLKFRQKSFKKLHRYIFKNMNGVIASDLDYHIPLRKHPNYLGLIPNPINTDIFSKKTLEIKDAIVIFHGINRESYFKKGNDYFEKALQIVKAKYGEKITIITVENIPYNDYITLYDKAHILLDQVYAHDQGYNALEAMAKGKAVFTGADLKFEKRYDLTEKVAVNAKADVAYLVEELSFLIENPSEIIAIGKNARNFIEKEHDYVKIAKKYLEVWESN
jgi:glycosyltransferase involved in cell wall biosynthesis